MSVAMTVRMPSARAMSPSMSVVVMSKCSHTNEVYNQTQAAHDEQFGQSLGFSALQNSFEGLDHNLDADEPIKGLANCAAVKCRPCLHQENTVCEATQRLDFAKAVREASAGWPLACNRRKKTDSKSNTVEEHVDAVAEQAERVGDIAVESLDCHEAEVETVSSGVVSNGAPQSNPSNVLTS